MQTTLVLRAIVEYLLRSTFEWSGRRFLYLVVSGESLIAIINKFSVVNGKHQSAAYCIWERLSLAGGVYVAYTPKGQNLKANGQSYKARKLIPGIYKSSCFCLCG